MSFPDRIQAILDELTRARRRRELRPSRGISFSHNDYLGLSTHPAILEAGEWALRTFGAGSRGSRLLGGHSRIFEEAEEKIAAFFDAPAALFFSTGYLANLAVTQSLSPVVERVVSDERIHASLIDGIRATGLPKTIIPHNRWDTVLESSGPGPMLLVAESLYGMDGDFVELEALLDLWRKTDSFLLLDEAHAAGVFREDGKGFGADRRDWERMAVTVTFGKAFGVAGAAVLCSAEGRELLLNTARPFIYTTAPAPVVAAMVGASLEVVREEGWRREELWSRAVMVREILSAVVPPAEPLAQGAPCWAARSPIIPLPLPGDDKALIFCESMQESGIELRAIRYPTVPRGSERARISLNLGVSRENTETMIREVVRRWTAFSSRESIPT